MNKFVIITTYVVLLINGIGALYGGFNLITDPTGGSMQMPLNFLEASPFHNYLIPGIILFTVNGIFSLFTLVVLLLKKRTAGIWVFTQGILLGGWIVMQIIFLRIFYAPLHLPFLFFGAYLTLAGPLIYRKNTV